MANDVTCYAHALSRRYV